LPSTPAVPGAEPLSPDCARYPCATGLARLTGACPVSWANAPVSLTCGRSWSTLRTGRCARHGGPRPRRQESQAAGPHQSADRTARLLRAAALERLVGRDERRRHGGVEASAHPAPAHGGAPPGARVAGDGRGPRLGRARRRAGRVHRCVGSCLEGAYPPTFDPPDVHGRDLVEVIDGLVALTTDRHRSAVTGGLRSMTGHAGALPRPGFLYLLL
jgi:hypothetical protein